MNLRSVAISAFAVVIIFSLSTAEANGQGKKKASKSTTSGCCMEASAKMSGNGCMSAGAKTSKECSVSDKAQASMKNGGKDCCAGRNMKEAKADKSTSGDAANPAEKDNK